MLTCISATFAQFKVDPTVEQKYEAALKKVPANIRKEYVVGDAGVGGLSKFIKYRVDTLNKEELKDLSSITVLNDDGKPNDVSNQDDNIWALKIPFISFARLSNDTLDISTSMEMGYPYISHYITGKKKLSVYREYYKGDTILRAGLKDNKSERLNIPIKTTEFILNTDKFKVGAIIYGLVTFETEPWYRDDGFFESGHIKVRYRGSYVFKMKIIK